MAYQTGTVANSTALKTIIESFISANGWTASTGGLIADTNAWYSNGNSSIKVLNNYNTFGAIRLNGAYTYGAVGIIEFPNAHNFTTGQSITILESNVSNLIGTFIVTVTSSNQITFPVVNISATHIFSTSNSTTYITTPDTTTLTLYASTGTSGAGTLSKRTGITLPINSWPATYHLFSFGSPANVVCALNYDALSMQYLMFGDIVKVHNSAYVGGNYIYGSSGCNNFNNYKNGYLNLDSFSDDAMVTADNMYITSSGQVVPFTNNYFDSYGTGSYIHAKIDAFTWAESYGNSIASGCALTIQTLSQLYRSPNSWNSQAQLVVMHLQVVGASTLFHYLGYIEHVRLLRIDNYNLGDIITIGSDKWKVFPCHKKDITNRNGLTTHNITTTPFASGTLGYAIRYDGP